MNGREVTFKEPWTVELTEIQIDTENLTPSDIVVETEATIVSAGTELAILSGNEGWARLPFTPGYGSVGRVLAVGSGVTEFAVGDRVFSYAKHASVTTIPTRLVLPVPEGLDPKKAVLARMAQVSFTSVRISDVELGDIVAVQGLGLVGNLAAQLMALSGATVIGIDISESRLATARACGLEHVINATEQDPVARVREISGGAMCQTVVEATGIPDQVVAACRLAGKPAEVILLGSPRGELHADAMELLNSVHLWAQNSVTLKGAHEWRYPAYQDPEGFAKHSLARNIGIAFDLMMKGRLHTDELITHTVSPARCADVYENLRNRNEDYFGVVFDWTAE